MDETARLAAWGNFYVIVGSSGGALIGIQFVVITLIAGMRRPAAQGAVSAFATPTVVHFTVALLVSAVMSAPWPALAVADAALAACGLGGLAYAVVVVHRARRQTDYRPVWEDWLWYAALPCSAYLALSLSALFLRSRTEGALFVIAAAALGLLLIGVHNAWDSVTHIVFHHAAADPTARKE